MCQSTTKFYRALGNVPLREPFMSYSQSAAVYDVIRCFKDDVRQTLIAHDTITKRHT